MKYILIICLLIISSLGYSQSKLTPEYEKMRKLIKLQNDWSYKVDPLFKRRDYLLRTANKLKASKTPKVANGYLKATRTCDSLIHIINLKYESDKKKIQNS